MASLLTFARSSRSRALALLGLAVVLAATLVVAGARAAVSASSLPAVTAEELLASVATAAEDPPPITGEIATSVELGLPDVGGLGGEGGGAEGLSAVTGDQRLRLWKSEDGFRVAQLDDASERAFVTDGRVAWLWDSTELTAERFTAPRDNPHGGGNFGSPTEPSDLDPAALAARALAMVEDDTEVRVDATGRVAGRDTYRLVLTPRADATLVGRVEVDVDGEERVPLRTAVFARDAAAPSIEAGFTSVSFAPIDPATFTFTPPPGAEVTERDGDGHADGRGRGGAEDGAGRERSLEALGRSRPDVRTFGEGWATVVAVPRPADTPAADEEGPVASLDALLPFSGPLFSARAAEGDDGAAWILFGAVDQATLEQAAADL